MVKAILLFIARSVLQMVLAALAKLVARMLEEVIKPMQDVAQMLSGNNDVWRGAGANKFVDVVSSMLVPSAQRSEDRITRLRTNLSTACDTVDQADAEAEQMVRSRLYDGFNFYQGA